VLDETTSSITARGMAYETLNTSWEELHATKLTKPATIGGVAGFYGYYLKLSVKHLLEEEGI
jgi:hypothetical protein